MSDKPEISLQPNIPPYMLEDVRRYAEREPIKPEFWVKEEIGPACGHEAGLERVDFGDEYVRGPQFKINTPIPVPGAGHWVRGGQHEGKFELINKDIGVSITVRHPWCERDEMERWLVETLHVWPHPLAPLECDEGMCPDRRKKAYAHMQEAYARLLNSGKMAGETKVETE